MNNIVDNNSENKKEIRLLVRVANALSSLDNECLKMRDRAKILASQGNLELAKYNYDLKEQYYSLLHHAYKYLYDLNRIKVIGL